MQLSYKPTLAFCHYQNRSCKKLIANKIWTSVSFLHDTKWNDMPWWSKYPHKRLYSITSKCMKAKYGVQKGMKRVFGCASEKINGFILWKKKEMHLGAIFGCFGALSNGYCSTSGRARGRANQKDWIIDRFQMIITLFWWDNKKKGDNTCYRVYLPMVPLGLIKNRHKSINIYNHLEVEFCSDFFSPTLSTKVISKQRNFIHYISYHFLWIDIFFSLAHYKTFSIPF